MGDVVLVATMLLVCREPPGTLQVNQSFSFLRRAVRVHTERISSPEAG